MKIIFGALLAVFAILTISAFASLIVFIKKNENKTVEKAYKGIMKRFIIAVISTVCIGILCILAVIFL